MKAKRHSLTARERLAMRAAQQDACALCSGALGAGFIAEHSWPVAMGNEAKPDCLVCARCAADKTRGDIRMIAKTKRQAGLTGQQARRAKRKAEGRGKLWPARKITSRGFDRTLRKKFDGRVEQIRLKGE